MPTKEQYQKNKEKYLAIRKAWVERNPGYLKKSERKWRYGLSDDDYMTMLTRQEGMCAVCKRGLTEGRKSRSSACVDHCHETGRVRGILCSNCNVALGKLDDDPVKIAALLVYMS